MGLREIQKKSTCGEAEATAEATLPLVQLGRERKEATAKCEKGKGEGGREPELE